MYENSLSALKAKTLRLRLLPREWNVLLYPDAINEGAATESGEKLNLQS